MERHCARGVDSISKRRSLYEYVCILKIEVG